MSQPSGSGLPAIPIAVEFELGRVSLSLAEVETWAPGTVIPVAPPAPEAGAEVTVRANGQVIGVGELVRLDDRLAVRLSRLTA